MYAMIERDYRHGRARIGLLWGLAAGLVFCSVALLYAGIALLPFWGPIMLVAGSLLGALVGYRLPVSRPHLIWQADQALGLGQRWITLDEWERKGRESIFLAQLRQELEQNWSKPRRGLLQRRLWPEAVVVTALLLLFLGLSVQIQPLPESETEQISSGADLEFDQLVQELSQERLSARPLFQDSRPLFADTEKDEEELTGDEERLAMDALAERLQQWIGPEDEQLWDALQRRLAGEEYHEDDWELPAPPNGEGNGGDFGSEFFDADAFSGTEGEIEWDGMDWFDGLEAEGYMYGEGELMPYEGEEPQVRRTAPGDFPDPNGEGEDSFQPEVQDYRTTRVESPILDDGLIEVYLEQFIPPNPEIGQGGDVPERILAYRSEIINRLPQERIPTMHRRHVQEYFLLLTAQ